MELPVRVLVVRAPHVSSFDLAFNVFVSQRQPRLGFLAMLLLGLLAALLVARHCEAARVMLKEDEAPAAEGAGAEKEEAPVSFLGGQEGRGGGGRQGLRKQ